LLLLLMLADVAQSFDCLDSPIRKPPRFGKRFGLASQQMVSYKQHPCIARLHRSSEPLVVTGQSSEEDDDRLDADEVQVLRSHLHQFPKNLILKIYSILYKKG